MTSKLIRARDAILQFIKTANPEDEFFVIGFNDRPELIEDFTSSVEDIEARLATVHSGHRTALLDAIYYGVEKMREARHERKALLVVSDGGDNRSRYTEGEVRAQVRESDVEIYSVGIFDPYARNPRGAHRADAAERALRGDRRTALSRRRHRLKWATLPKRFRPSYATNM